MNISNIWDADYKVLGMGHLLVDILVFSSSFFSVEEFLQKNDFKKGSYASVSLLEAENLLQQTQSATTSLHTGGAVCNSMSYLTNQNVCSGLIGTLGDDDYGQFFKKSATQSNHLSLLLQDRFTSISQTGFCIVFVTPDGERTMRTFIGCSSDLLEPPSIVPTCEDFLLESFLWEREENIPISIRWIQKIMDKSPGVTMNLCAGNLPVFSRQRDLICDLAQKNFLHRIFLNKEEAICLTGTSSIQDVVSTLLDNFSMVVVTDGENGSWIGQSSDIQHIPAVKGNFLNSTGAGDIYVGAFIRNLQLKERLDVCGQLASQAVTEFLGTSRVLQT